MFLVLIPLDNLEKWNWSEEKTIRPCNFLVDRANDVLTWAEEHLLRGTFGRDDYRELCELVVHYLGGRVLRPRLNAPPRFGFKMRAPWCFASC